MITSTMSKARRRESWARRCATPVTAVILAVSVAGGARASVSQSAAGSSSDSAVTSDSSVLDGVFTSRQASEGARKFEQVCSDYCHKAREFSGDQFRTKWNGRTLRELFDLMSTMPPEDPGSLNPEEYAAVVAHLLSLNDYPAGEKPLPADVSALGKIRFKEPPAK